MTEMRYVERCLDRVREDSVEIKEVIKVFIVSKNISESSSITSCVSKVIMSSKLESWFIEELERPPREEASQEFKDRLMAILRGLARYAPYTNILDDVKRKINVNKSIKCKLDVKLFRLVIQALNFMYLILLR